MRVVLLAALAAVTVGLFAFPAGARADATVEESTVVSEYPQRLLFRLVASADMEITDVTLSYSLTGRGASALAKPETFTPGSRVTAEVAVDVNTGQAFIPVGSEFVYRWQITMADGSVTITDDASYLHLPPDRQWESVSNDFMVVYYHGDRRAMAERYLEAAADTYERIGKGLLKTELVQVPVKVILFADEAEMSRAQQGRGTTYDAATITCGTKHTNDIVYVIPVNCGSPDPTDTLRHEFGHILNQTAGEGVLTKLPAWLDEGTAVYAQSTPGGYADAFSAAARAGRLIPFDQLGSPSTDPRLVGVFYGQSWAMVAYLIEEKGGPDRFAEFYATIKGGTRFDEALEQVYGFDLAGFEREFLAAVSGAQPQQPTPRPTPPAQDTQPTPAPTREPPAQVRQLDTGDDGLSRTTIAIFGLAILFALLGVMAFLFALMLQNSRLQAAQREGGLPPADDWSPRDEG